MGHIFQFTSLPAEYLLAPVTNKEGQQYFIERKVTEKAKIE